MNTTGDFPTVFRALGAHLYPGNFTQLFKGEILVEDKHDFETLVDRVRAFLSQYTQIQYQTVHAVAYAKYHERVRVNFRRRGLDEEWSYVSFRLLDARSETAKAEAVHALATHTLKGHWARIGGLEQLIRNEERSPEALAEIQNVINDLKRQDAALRDAQSNWDLWYGSLFPFIQITVIFVVWLVVTFCVYNGFMYLGMYHAFAFPVTAILAIACLAWCLLRIPPRPEGTWHPSKQHVQ